MNPTRATVVLSFLTLLGSYDHARACSCGAIPTLREALEGSVAVFFGEVVAKRDLDVTKSGGPSSRGFTFRVSRAWKGVITDTVEVGTSSSGTACGYSFSVGDEYVVYAYPRGWEGTLMDVVSAADGQPQLWTSQCTPTGDYNDSAFTRLGAPVWINPSVTISVLSGELREAIDRGDTERVRELVLEGHDVNGKDRYWGETALITAASRGDAEMVRVLLQAGARVNEIKRHTTALIEAAKRGHTDIVRILLSSGADPARIEGLSLVVAAGEGKLATVDLLLASGVAANDRTEFGSTALAAASREGHLAVVRRLLASGADPNPPGWPSPVDAAARGGHVEIVRALLASGARVRREELKGAASNREMLRLLEKAYAAQPDETSPEELIEAARQDDTSVLERLVEEKPELDARDAWGGTALVEAICCGRPAAVALLVRSGADVNAGTSGRRPTTPLRAAIVRGDMTILRRLIRSGVDLRAGSPLCQAALAGNLKVVDLLLNNGAPPDDEQCPPLMAAAGSGRLAVVKRLLEAGADPTRANTALHSAVARGATHVLRVLIEHGMDVNGNNGWQGGTPLHQAVLSRSLGSVDILLDAGANVDARDASGSTPLMAALPNFGRPAYEPLEHRRNGMDPHRAMIERLLDGGADVDAVDRFGRTVLAQAELLGDGDVVKLLRYKARER